MPNINRRRVLKGLTVGSGVMLAGCGGGGDGGDGGDGGGDGGDGGMEVRELVFSDADVPTSLDPHAFDFTNTNNQYAYPENGYEPLLYFPASQDSNEPVPVLATEVPTANNGLISNGGRTLDFPLREGVTFHTGGEMTAEDVMYSFNRVMTMGLSAGAATLDNAIESMEAVDDYTFRLTLAEANTPVFLNSTVTQSYVSIVSKEAVEANGGVQEGQPNEWVAQNSAGTGPFVLGERRPNEVVWEPHEDYWGETSVDRVVQQVDPDLSARLAKLRRGEVHWAWASPGVYSEVEGIQGINITSAPQFNPGGFIFNANIPYDRDDMSDLDDTVPPDFFADKDVRNAFKFAFDWESFVSGTMSGLASRTRSIHVKGMFGFDESAPMVHQDLEQAEQHLRNAGYWEEGFTITLFNENNPEFDVLNVRMKDAMEGLNDRITINSVKEPEGPGVARHNRDPPGFPFEAHALLPVGADPTPYYEFWCHPDGGMGSRTGIPEVIDSQIPDLIEQSSTETDLEARADIFAQLQRLVYEEAPVVLGYTPEIINPWLECVEPSWSNQWIRPHWKHQDISNC